MAKKNVRTSAYGDSSSILNPWLLYASVNCATLEERPFFPQSYCCVVGTTLNTVGVVAVIFRWWSWYWLVIKLMLLWCQCYWWNECHIDRAEIHQVHVPTLNNRKVEEEEQRYLYYIRVQNRKKCRPICNISFPTSHEVSCKVVVM